MNNPDIIPCPQCSGHRVCGSSFLFSCDKHLRETYFRFKRLVDDPELCTPSDKAIFRELTAEWQTRDAYKLREWLNDVANWMCPIKMPCVLIKFLNA